MNGCIALGERGVTWIRLGIAICAQVAAEYPSARAFGSGKLGISYVNASHRPSSASLAILNVNVKLETSSTCGMENASVKQSGTPTYGAECGCKSHDVMSSVPEILSE